MKEKLLNTFKTLGFILEKMDDFGYGFKYEGKNYVWVPNSDDDDFLSIVMPGVVERDDIESEIKYYKMIDLFNARLKYVKANDYYDSIWLSYERELIGEEQLDDVITHMVLHLNQASHFFGSIDWDHFFENNDTDDGDELDDLDDDGEDDELGLAAEVDDNEGLEDTNEKGGE